MAIETLVFPVWPSYGGGNEGKRGFDFRGRNGGGGRVRVRIIRPLAEAQHKLAVELDAIEAHPKVKDGTRYRPDANPERIQLSCKEFRPQLFENFRRSSRVC